MTNIQSFLEVSTLHLPSSDSLSELDCVIAEYDEGGFLYIPMGDEFDSSPDWLKKVFELALDYKCGYVRFDADASSYECLQQFDW